MKFLLLFVFLFVTAQAELLIDKEREVIQIIPDERNATFFDFPASSLNLIEYVGPDEAVPLNQDFIKIGPDLPHLRIKFSWNHITIPEGEYLNVNLVYYTKTPWTTSAKKWVYGWFGNDYDSYCTRFTISEEGQGFSNGDSMIGELNIGVQVKTRGETVIKIWEECTTLTLYGSSSEKPPRLQGTVWI
jgi:hypothetical protein